MPRPQPSDRVNGKWVKKPRWGVSHYLRDDERVMVGRLFEARVTGLAACGAVIAVDEYLEDEPTGMDTCDRCERCCVLTGAGE